MKQKQLKSRSQTKVRAQKSAAIICFVLFVLILLIIVFLSQQNGIVSKLFFKHSQDGTISISEFRFGIFLLVIGYLIVKFGYKHLFRLFHGDIRREKEERKRRDHEEDGKNA
ncbi:hypothetical protein ADUPG1_000085 [Aduncisulcus paluster]|uniref:DUF1049 domain-containing protein n=1 Tax=Aduncisulcus paluster TaxID=2918883 RepID=A0ABQ5K4Q5_9EUKA|nr:hypothetical protein ADUPG1_000085 [Aduncisulcus paluster]